MVVIIPTHCNGRPKPPPPMRVLVNDTGSYAGQSIVETLQAQGHTVVAIVGESDDGPVPEAVTEKLKMRPFTTAFNETVLSVCRSRY